MDLNLTNKRVLITGSSRGIGYGMANAFLGEGARVVLLDWEYNRLTQSADELCKIYGKDRVLAFTIDCADAQAWTKVINEIDAAWGGIDVAIANVGDGRGPQDALPKADRFATAWRSNFNTSEETARATLPMLEESGGCLLFISSVAGLEAIGAPTDYSVAKSALIALTKQMARRLAPRIRVNCIAPGNVYFPDGSWDEKIKKDPQRVELIIQSTVPMQRFGTPSEIADAALFLCSARAAFITGSCLVVDGGQTVGIF
jgi:3-oxoacyl-[acyl-carrier protein] reductase